MTIAEWVKTSYINRENIYTPLQWFIHLKEGIMKRKYAYFKDGSKLTLSEVQI
jgi:hypothetical protein